MLFAEDKMSYRTHGHATERTATYNAWQGMKARCSCKSHSSFHRYGARGIKVCDRWLQSFENFLSDMGEAPPGLTLDRKDNDGHYEPSNCRWASKKVQSNNRGDNRLIEFDGKVQTLEQWANEVGVSSQTLWMRLDYGWSVQKALTTPLAPNKGRFTPGSAPWNAPAVNGKTVGRYSLA